MVNCKYHHLYIYTLLFMLECFLCINLMDRVDKLTLDIKSYSKANKFNYFG